MREWTKYYVTIANQLGKRRSIGQKLEENILDDFTGEQLHQLHDLYNELKE